MTLRSSLFLFSILGIFSTQATSALKRSAYLGLSPVSAAAGDQVEVATIHPNGTGNSIGLEAGDRLKSINNIAITDFPHLVATLGNTLEGEPFVIPPF